MSICGNCPYPYERSMAGFNEPDDEACGGGCTFEDAVYRAQWAYDQLYERYKKLLKEKGED